MSVNEKWAEIKKNSHHTCNCHLCTISIDIAEKTILHINREMTAIEVERYMEEIVDPDYKPLRKKEKNDDATSG